MQALKSFVTKCLEEADNKGHSSIAFPAIGTGNLGYPKDIVAEEMFEAVSQFSKKNPRSSVRNVDFVLYPKDTATIKVNERALVMGSLHVHTSKLM